MQCNVCKFVWVWKNILYFKACDNCGHHTFSDVWPCQSLQHATCVRCMRNKTVSWNAHWSPPVRMLSSSSQMHLVKMPPRWDASDLKRDKNNKDGQPSVICFNLFVLFVCLICFLFDLLPNLGKEKLPPCCNCPSAPKIGGLSDLNGRLESPEAEQWA